MLGYYLIRVAVILGVVVLAIEGYYVYQFYADLPDAPVADTTTPQTQPGSPTSVPEPESEAEYAGMLKVANWQMNETFGQMIDSSANDNNGIPTDVLQTGSTYLFNGSTSHVFVPDDDSLDPLDKDITLTASVRVNGESLDDDSYDIVRKGFFDTAGGYYKMEIKRTSNPTVGKLHCLFKGTGGIVNIEASTDIVDGNWHTLECIKTSDSVVARVDGGRSYTKVGTAGSIANASGVMVGAKKANPFDDMFDSSMDFVGIDIAQ